MKDKHLSPADAARAERCIPNDYEYEEQSDICEDAAEGGCGWPNLCDVCKRKAAAEKDPCTCHLLPKVDMDGSRYTGLCPSCEKAATEAGYDKWANGWVGS